MGDRSCAQTVRNKDVIVLPGRTALRKILKGKRSPYLLFKGNRVTVSYDFRTGWPAGTLVTSEVQTHVNTYT